jgi:signal transduction histidine kinase
MERLRQCMQFCRTICLPIAVLCFGASIVLESGFATPVLGEQKKVLLLYDSRSDMWGNIIVDRTIRSILNDEFDVNLDVHSEYFEASAESEREYEALLNWLTAKYARTKFDVVVAVGANALRFTSMYGGDLFQGAQIVFSGRKEGINDWKSLAPLTGVVAPDIARNLKATVDFIRNLQPDLRQLVVVSGAAPIDVRWEVAARGALQNEAPFAVSYLSALTLEELQVRVAQLPQRTAIVFLTMSEDGAGRHLSKSDVLRMLVRAASAPVYIASAVEPDTGIFGGVLVNQQTMASATATVISRLLRGERGHDIPIQESPITPTVNWQQLHRWNIPESRVPSGTAIMQRELSIWELYRWPIIAVLSLCALEAALIVALLIYRARRIRAQRSLTASKRLLQSTIDALKQAHDAQQRLTGLLLRAQDDERRRIARDLHDVTVQNLAAIKAVLMRVQRGLGEVDGKIVTKIDEGLALSDQVIQELRTLSYVLHPPLLDELGLVPAVRSFIRGFMERSGIQVELVVNGEIGRLNADLETALFRVVQESLSNIHRHSGSPTALICATQDDSAVVLQISDGGRGITSSAASAQPTAALGVGIMGMGERLRQLGGQLDIESGERGTTVTARVPILKETLCRVS